MKKTFFNVLAVASVITTAAFLLDADVKEPSVTIRFIEYTAMLGIVCIILAAATYTFRTARRHIMVKS